MMNLRLPPSSALSCITAWAVVAEPEKKSRIMSSFCEENLNNLSIKLIGLGLEKKVVVRTISFASNEAWVFKIPWIIFLYGELLLIGLPSLSTFKYIL